MANYMSHDFDYMPRGSYAILPNGKPFFRQELPEKLKQRFIKDLEEKRKRDHETWHPHAFRP